MRDHSNYEFTWSDGPQRIIGEETAGYPQAGDVTDWTPDNRPSADRVEDDRVWNETFDAYHSTGSTIEGAMSRADDAVRRWRSAAKESAR